MTEKQPEAVHYAAGVVAVAAEVYRILGEGNIESVYENAMAVEFRKRGIPYAIENNVEVLYKGECVGMQRLDFVVGGVLAVELKAVSKITSGHEAQTRAYMQTANFEEALIVNFPSPKQEEPQVKAIFREERGAEG